MDVNVADCHDQSSQVPYSAMSSSLAIKHTHKHMESQSSITTKSPPAKKSLTKERLDPKSLCEALLTKEHLNPDSLREALKVGGTADLDISKGMKCVLNF